jgi:hypothetical protein
MGVSGPGPRGPIDEQGGAEEAPGANEAQAAEAVKTGPWSPVGALPFADGIPTTALLGDIAATTKAPSAPYQKISDDLENVSTEDLHMASSEIEVDPAKLKAVLASPEKLKQFVFEAMKAAAGSLAGDLPSGYQFTPSDVTLESLAKGDVFKALQSEVSYDGAGSAEKTAVARDVKAMTDSMLHGEKFTNIYHMNWSDAAGGTDDAFGGVIAIDKHSGKIRVIEDMAQP